MRDITISYIGQRCSRVSGHYLLGNGYRGFNPVLRRFARQDSMSPFGAGGEHGFNYCGGNPVNQCDPSGHGPLIDLIFVLGETVPRALRNGERLGLVESKALADACAATGTTFEIENGVYTATGTSIAGKMTTDDAKVLLDEMKAVFASEDLELTSKRPITKPGIRKGLMLARQGNNSERFYYRIGVRTQSFKVHSLRPYVYTYDRKLNKLVLDPLSHIEDDGFLARHEARLQEYFAQRNASPIYDEPYWPSSSDASLNLPSTSAGSATGRETKHLRWWDGR